MRITNARLPGYPGVQQIQIDAQGCIQAIQPLTGDGNPGQGEGEELLDVAGDWISLGGVDLQINGALGLAFPDLAPGDEEKVVQICQFLWQQGVDGFLPTIVTTAMEKIQRSLSVLQSVMTAQQARGIPSAHTAEAAILGVHLEGPFLNPEKRGAHPAEYLLPLTVEQVQRVLGDRASTVKVITLAPELDPTGEAIRYLKAQDILVSLGHSQATAEQATQAFGWGADQVTHAFNAMPGLHHRHPGLLGAAIAHPQVMCGLIADGDHVVPMMVQFLLRAGEYDRGLFLVSDALAPLGLPDGTYPWDSRQITVTQGTARLANGTLAGTTLPLLAGVQNLVRWGVCGAESAIALATTAPRRALHQSGLVPGQPATFLRWQVLASEPPAELTWQRVPLPRTQLGG